MRDAEVGIALLVAVGFVVSWARLFPDLKTKSGYGIVAFELPRSVERAQAILAAWRRTRLEGAARRSITLDWCFIAMYVVAFACAGVLVAGDDDTVAVAFVVAAVVAGVLDVLENVGMKAMLDGTVSSAVVFATTAVSAVKWFVLFVLVVALVVYLP